MSFVFETKARDMAAPSSSFLPVSGKINGHDGFGPRKELADVSREPLVSQPSLTQHEVQPKLRIGQPGDKYEQEADRVAEQVISIPEPRIRRQVEPGEEEEEIQAKPIAEQITPLVQKKEEEPEEEEEEPEEEEEEEPIQAKPEDYTRLQCQAEEEEEEEEEETIQTKKAGGQTPLISYSLQSRMNFLKGGGQPLPESTREYFEPRFGYDFSGVRVHTGSKASETARSINAEAFTKREDIVFGSGQYNPGSISGNRLLAHELTHVVQQGNVGQSQLAKYSKLKTVPHKRTTPILNAGTSKSVIRRKVSCTPARKVHGKPNEVSISTIEGKKRTDYVVIRSFEISEEPVTKWKNPDPSAGFGWDKDNIWIEIDWCKNTKGNIQIGSAGPRAIQDLFRDLSNQLSSGELHLGKALKETNFQHFIKWMLRVKSGWKLTGGIYTELKGGSEYSGAGGEVCWGKWPFEVCLKGGHSKEYGGHVQVNVKVIFEKVPEGFKCPKEREQTSKLVIKPKYTCKQFIPPGTKEVTRMEPYTDKSFYIYFPYIRYEKEEIDKKRSQIIELVDALKAGYEVVSITGHASPEGPIKRKTRSFMGNEALAQERANTAKEFVKDICLSVGCKGDIDKIVSKGEKELYTKWKNGKEAVGQEQAEEAIKKFLTRKAERRHWKDPDFIKKLRIAQKRAKYSKPLIEKVYTHLRRAEITLTKEKERPVKTTVKTEAWWKTLDICPTNCILMDAKKYFDEMDKK